MSTDGGRGSGAPRVSGMAIGSLILGLLGCTSPVGLVLGIVAILQINNDPDRITGKGLAIAGVVVSGLVMLLGPALYVAAAMPVFVRARDKGQQAACLSNANELAIALRAYATDYEGVFPLRATWSDDISTYMRHTVAYVCPADRSKAPCSYVFSDALGGTRQAALTDPRSTPMLWDGTPGWNVSGGLSSVVYRHPERSGGVPVDRATVAFADGHVEPIADNDLRRRWPGTTGAIPAPPSPQPPPSAIVKPIGSGPHASAGPGDAEPRSREMNARERYERASERAPGSACMSNLKQVGLASLMYTQDYDERWAPASRWCDGIRPYLRNDEIYVCPVLPDARCGYTLNERLGSIWLGEIARPQETPAAFDGAGGWNRSGALDAAMYRHLGEANVVFVDGHATSMDEHALKSIGEKGDLQ